MSASIAARWRRWWIILGAGFVVLVIYLSLTPDPLQAPTIDDFKTGHILAYLWCMLWFAQVWRGIWQRLAVATLLVALGIALEYAQRETGYRHFAYSDMVDDAIGVGAGWLLALTPLGTVLGNALERRRP